MIISFVVESIRRIFALDMYDTGYYDGLSHASKIISEEVIKYAEKRKRKVTK